MDVGKNVKRKQKCPLNYSSQTIKFYFQLTFRFLFRSFSLFFCTHVKYFFFWKVFMLLCSRKKLCEIVINCDELDLRFLISVFRIVWKVFFLSLAVSNWESFISLLFLQWNISKPWETLNMSYFLFFMLLDLISCPKADWRWKEIVLAGETTS